MGQLYRQQASAVVLNGKTGVGECQGNASAGTVESLGKRVVWAHYGHPRWDAAQEKYRYFRSKSSTTHSYDPSETQTSSTVFSIDEESGGAYAKRYRVVTESETSGTFSDLGEEDGDGTSAVDRDYQGYENGYHEVVYSDECTDEILKSEAMDVLEAMSDPEVGVSTAMLYVPVDPFMTDLDPAVSIDNTFTWIPAQAIGINGSGYKYQNRTYSLWEFEDYYMTLAKVSQRWPIFIDDGCAPSPWRLSYGIVTHLEPIGDSVWPSITVEDQEDLIIESVEGDPPGTETLSEMPWIELDVPESPGVRYIGRRLMLPESGLGIQSERINHISASLGFVAFPAYKQPSTKLYGRETVSGDGNYGVSGYRRSAFEELDGYHYWSLENTYEPWDVPFVGSTGFQSGPEGGWSEGWQYGGGDFSQAGPGWRLVSLTETEAVWTITEGDTTSTLVFTLSEELSLGVISSALQSLANLEWNDEEAIPGGSNEGSEMAAWIEGPGFGSRNITRYRVRAAWGSAPELPVTVRISWKEKSVPIVGSAAEVVTPRSVELTIPEDEEYSEYSDWYEVLGQKNMRTTITEEEIEIIAPEVTMEWATGYPLITREC